MMKNKPIRTYQRKTTKKPLINSNSLAPPPVLLTGKYSTEHNHFDESDTCVGSISYDPFETTFDRIAKGAVVPPLPMDTNPIDSWNNTSDSDINNATSPVKCPEYKAFDHLAHESIKLVHKRKGSQRRKPEVVVTKGILPKRTKVMSLENKIQSRTKAQERKKRTNKIQRKKVTQYKSKKLKRTCDEQISYSGTTNNLKDILHTNDILCNYNNKHSYQNNLKNNENVTITSKTTLNRVNNSTTTSKYKSDYYQYIKPCSVELDAHTVQKWYILNHKKTMEGKKENIHHTKLSCINTSKINEDNPEIHKATSQSISTDYIGISKHMSIKRRLAILRDSVVKDGDISKNKKSTNHSIDTKDKLNIPLTLHNLSETASLCDTYIDIAASGMKKYRENRTKYCLVKMERLDIEHIKKKHIILNEKEQNMISSTPISKHAKCFAHSMLLSPIDNNTRDKSDLTYETSTAIVKEDVSVIVPPDKCDERKNSTHLLITSQCCKIDAADMQEQETQVLLSSQELLTAADPVVKTEAISSEINIHTALTQKYNTEHDIETGFPDSLNISANTNQSRSLFSDTTYSHNNSAEDAVGNNIEKKDFGSALECESAKVDVAVSLHLPAHLNLKQKQLLNDNAHVSSEYVLSSKIGVSIETLEDLDNIVHTRERFKRRKKQSIDMKALRESSKSKTINDSKHSFVSESQDNINVIDNVLLAQLLDSNRVTERRMQYSKWHLNMSNISQSLSNRSRLSNNKVLNYVTIDECSNVPSTDSKNAIINSSLENFKLLNDVTQKHSNDINVRVERPVFLKPGKCWTRSLSILNNINTESNLDKLSVGKGKKWRHSVRDIFDMQKQGIFQSCLKKDEDNTDLSCGGFNALDVSSFGSNRCKASESVTYARFSKRVSVRVVPNNTSTTCDIEDTLFLEAFGITAENSPSKLKVLHPEISPARDLRYNDDDRISKSHLTTAKDVVLRRCSQEYYLPFSEYFPDSYLEHCRKIGEGVYGEVFLYEYNDKKSVIKIIPIEGEVLVNGEPQKKFNEVLSEIVIAKELHNLRLHTTYRTTGFVEVRNVKCIIGKYPEKLIKLWNIYDDDKTSDNDCPSIFGENQLYIALEFGYGGEDLEAFVFQTAEESCALFLQIALTLAIAEKESEFEHRDLHWGNILISRTKESYIYYNFGGKEIKFPSNGVKVSIIDFTLSRMLYQECCIYNDLALDPALFTAHGEYQFEIYRLMRNKIQNNWQKFEPYTNILWFHYILDKMITAARYKRKNLKAHKHAIIKLKEFRDVILNYDSAFDFVSNSSSIACLQSK